MVAGNLLRFESANAYFIRDDIRTERVQALEAADDFLRSALAAETVVPTQTDSVALFDLFLVFKSAGPTMTTPALLDFVYDLNQEFVQSDTYTDVCLRDGDGLCVAPTTVMEARAPHVANATYLQLGPNPTQGEVDTVTAQYATDSSLFVQRNYVFDESFSNTNLNSKFMRSYFPSGLPLKGYANRADREEDQMKDLVDFIRPFHERVNEGNLKLPDGGEVVLFGGPIWNVVLDEQLSKDTMWAAGAVVFVFIYMCVHVHSLFLATCGIIQILLAFPFAFLIYFGVFGITMFDALHSLAVFVIIGIGADDIFVFHSAWEQYGGKPDDYEGRMKFAFSHASKAMFVTSFTTMAAFLATAVNPILPIATFGLWAASLIFCNYLLVLSMFGSILVIWQRYVRRRESACAQAMCGCCCSRKSPAAAIEDSSARPTDGGAGSGSGSGKGGRDSFDAASPAKETPLTSATPTTLPTTHAPAAAQDKPGSLEGGGASPEPVNDRLIERFFGSMYYPTLLRCRFVFLGTFVVLLIVAVALSSQLQPLSTEENFFPDDHFITRANDWFDQFPATDSGGTVTVTVSHGLLGINRDGTDRFDPDDLGTPEWDRSFQAHQPAAQEHLSLVCDTLQNSSLVVSVDECWIWDFRGWLENSQSLSFPFVAAGPVPAGLTADEHQQYEFGEAILRWTNATTKGAVSLGNSYVGLVRGDPLGTAPNTTPEGVVEVWLSQIRLNVDLKPDSSRDASLPVYNAIEEMLEELNSAAPASAKFAAQAAQKWMWMETERALLRSAIQGIGISGAVAFVVLVFATMNVFVAFLSIICIFGIVATVMAIVFLLGWELGVTESITSVIVIGFSVDYVVHLATHFVDSRFKDRRRRTHDALITMGISILGGATSTGGAALFLFGAVIVFFTKMGIILLSTVLCSLVWSCIGLSSLLITIGPEGDTGNILPWLRKIPGVRKLPCCASDNNAKGSDSKHNAEGASAPSAGIEMTQQSP